MNHGTNGFSLNGGAGFSLGDLPTYLPNTLEGTNSMTGTNIIGKSEDEICVAETQTQGDEGSKVAEKEPIFIPGTSITLQTEEDIKKWIEERKRKWPTRKNIELKQKLRAESQRATDKGTGVKREAPDVLGGKAKTKRAKPICRFFQSTGKCKFGSRCRNVHEQLQTDRGTKIISDRPVKIPQRFKFESNLKSGGTENTRSLYQMLLQREHFVNENTEILEFIQYLNDQGLIDHNATTE